MSAMVMSEHEVIGCQIGSCENTSHVVTLSWDGKVRYMCADCWDRARKMAEALGYPPFNASPVYPHFREWFTGKEPDFDTRRITNVVCTGRNVSGAWNFVVTVTPNIEEERTAGIRLKELAVRRTSVTRSREDNPTGSGEVAVGPRALPRPATERAALPQAPARPATEGAGIPVAIARPAVERAAIPQAPVRPAVERAAIPKAIPEPLASASTTAPIRTGKRAGAVRAGSDNGPGMLAKAREFLRPASREIRLPPPSIPKVIEPGEERSSRLVKGLLEPKGAEGSK